MTNIADLKQVYSGAVNYLIPLTTDLRNDIHPSKKDLYSDLTLH